MTDAENRLKLLEAEIERRLVERFAALRDEFDRLRLESDHRWAGFLDRFEQKFAGIVPPEMMPSEPEATPAAGGLSVEAARSLDAAGNQVEALHHFLDLCGRYASRAALLVSRGEAIGVWKAIGFSDRGGSDEAVRRATLPSGPGTVLAQVMEGQPTELPIGNEISKALSARDACRAVLIPMVVKEKISGSLYADCVPSDESRFDPEALAFLTFLAGLIVDRLAARKLKPAPALRSRETAASPAAEAPPAEPEFQLAEEEPAQEHPSSRDSRMMEQPEPTAPVAPPPPDLYGVPSEHEPARPTESPFARPSRDFEQPPAQPERAMELAEQPEEPPASGATIRIPTSAIEAATAAPEPPPLGPSKSQPPAAPPLAPRVSSGARRLAGPLAPAEGDERRDEARRFAKLLVSEIKLYNEKAVVQGREHRNIYELLKEDIDRSRQMYDERIPEDVRANTNFFYEELVRILADGRAEALGL